MYRAHSHRRAEPSSARFRRGSRFLSLALAPVIVLLLAGGAAAQRAKEDNKPKIPPPEELEFETRDGVTLKATYLPGTRGKDTVPVILLHGYEGSRNEYAGLAKYLQGMGCAVLVPDLRGHGGSVEVKNDTRQLKASTMPGAQFQRMVTVDMEKLKNFLLAKNNQGELNIEKLCVVGAGMGATVAMEWALLDWSWPQLPTLKQGRDVKALVLISPKWSLRGLNVQKAFRHPLVRTKISVLIVVGSQGKSVSDAKRIHKMFAGARPKQQQPADKDLFLIERKTKLQGTELLNFKAFKIDQFIGQFTKLRLVNQSYPWTDRRSPLDRADR